MVVFDVIRRWLEASGFAVRYVRNITDIEDKIIKRAHENGETIWALTERFIRFMDEDAAALGVAQARLRAARHAVHPGHAAHHRQSLIERGLAYQAANGDVYYSVHEFPGYGKLSGKSLDDLRAGERVDVDPAKQDPLDFVLWKSAKPDEPSLGLALGQGPAGLAHRVLGDERAFPRRALRHPRRRAGSACSRITKTRSRSPKARTAMRS